MVDVSRFRISWKDGAYKVSIPDYDGGEVVRAEDYDRTREALETAVQWLRRLEKEHPGCLNDDAIDKHLMPSLSPRNPTP